jgi:YD repeat-containing protein
VHYDIMGRADQTSNPTEISGGFIPYGDDYTAGWQYTEQTYDWKGRPLVTTHPDSTTRTASYAGCGCAGGDVTTLQDEGTMISSTLTRRKQVITNDVLGRMVKAETFNWDGATVYSTVTNDYNAIDQVTLTKQYAGSTSSSNVQETTAEYDGYGRLYRQHVPEQFSPGLSSSPDILNYTTLTYNADDTRATITDGRGASTAYTYNNRRLVTQIDYAAPTGITVPDSTVFTYDGAGNRTSMTDDSGNTDYVYDQQSRLTEETRYFNLTLPSAPESGNGFKLQYTYGLDGSLATLTDPYSHTFTYARDNLGRLSSVTGTSFAGVTTYASNAEYRAWDAPKALDYGNTLRMSVTFNSRQQPATFEIGKTGSTIIQKAYDYYNDGRVKFANDLLNAKFDRLNKYDSIGHLEEGLTGARARGETLDEYANQPYQESFEYDAFGHITARSTRHWTAEYYTSDAYDRNRRSGWDYDADGRIARMGSTTDHDEVSYEYDAAGRESKITATANGRTEPAYDGDGRELALAKYFSSSYPSTPSENTLLIRSSVLGGKVVSEALGPGIGITTAAGLMIRSRVFADGTELVTLNKGFGGMSDTVRWSMIDPAQHSFRATRATGAGADYYFAEPPEAEMDPAGANVQTQNPYDSANPPLEPPVGSSSLFSFAVTPVDQRVTLAINDFVTPLSVTIDGMPMSLADIQARYGYNGIGDEFDLLLLQAYRSWIVRYDDPSPIEGEPNRPRYGDYSDGDPLGRDGMGRISVWNFWQGSREADPATQTGAKESVPSDLRARVVDITQNCGSFLAQFLQALGGKKMKVFSSDFGVLFDRIKEFSIETRAFEKASAPDNAVGLATGNGTNRRIFVKPDPTNVAAKNQEFRWNSVAATVVAELLHHSKTDGRFTDKDLDNAAKQLLSGQALLDAQGEIDTSGYRAGAVGHRLVANSCKPTNLYGPPPTR